MMPEQQIANLFSRTLVGDYEADEPWDAVRDLRKIGSREVFDRAQTFLAAGDELKQARALDVLAELGHTIENSSGNLQQERFAVIAQFMATQPSGRALHSALYALGHLGNPDAIPLLLPYCDSPDAKVRYAVTCSLGSLALDVRAIPPLLVLTRDADEDIRDWATFGIGTLSNFDDRAIRQALIDRLDDTFINAREEAIAGLAKRKEECVLPSLLAALREDNAPIIQEAAEMMLDMDELPENWSADDFARALCERYANYLKM